MNYVKPGAEPLTFFHSMLKNEGQNAERTARIYYELWKMKEEEEFRLRARKLYNKLMTRTKRPLCRRILKELM